MTIPYGRQDITDADIAAVEKVLRSDFLTQGNGVPEFEAALCALTGARHAVAANSATSCLHLACMALDVGPGDDVWCPSVTFVASANCALYCGAEVTFLDVEPDSGNIAIEPLAARLAQAETKGGLPKALVVVHMGGHPCDMQAIGELSRRYGFAVIEDASHAVGARIGEQRVGCGEHADITIFSFHPVKIITTAEGGAALTNDAQLAERMALLRSHGITRDPSRMQGESHGGWYYQQVALGFNYRMTDIHAALGVSQLERIDDYLDARHRIAARYDAALGDLGVLTVSPLEGTWSAWHLYVILVDETMAGCSRLEIFNALRAAGIGVNVHYIPVHSQPYHVARSPQPVHLPGADRYYARALSLPMFPTLTTDMQDEVIRQLDICLGEGA